MVVHTLPDLTTADPAFPVDAQIYEFREAEDPDIPHINNLLFSEYGENYPYPLSTFQPGGIYLVGCHRETGKIIGFAKAVPYKGHASVYEFGGLIVDGPHRTRHVAKQLTRNRMETIKQLGGAAVVSEPVCYRRDCASQANLIVHGFVLVGIQFVKYPDIQLDLLGSQAESVLMAVRWMRDTAHLGDRRVFLPYGYRGVLYSYLPRSLYERGWEQMFPDVEMPASVHHTGHQGTKTRGAEFVDVPGNWREAEARIVALHRDGFRFGCILPGFGTLAQGRVFDYVRMYRPSEGMKIDFKLVHVVPEISRLKAFCQADYQGEIQVR
ncbi:hypothetical protein HZA87_04070 [Candidatus Uhrbacteria bacterium]|nr:hypothetical protein [Candidatus Uhrbacteria bacterium]